MNMSNDDLKEQIVKIILDQFGDDPKLVFFDSGRKKVLEIGCHKPPFYWRGKPGARFMNLDPSMFLLEGDSPQTFAVCDSQGVPVYEGLVGTDFHFASPRPPEWGDEISFKTPPEIIFVT